MPGSVHVPVTSNQMPVSVPAKKLKHCSLPVSDVHCYVTNNTEIDSYTKNIVRYQINNKMVKRITPAPNTKLTPKKCAEDFGIEVTQAIKSFYTNSKP